MLFSDLNNKQTKILTNMFISPDVGYVCNTKRQLQFHWNIMRSCESLVPLKKYKFKHVHIRTLSTTKILGLNNFIINSLWICVCWQRNEEYWIPDIYFLLSIFLSQFTWINSPLWFHEDTINTLLILIILRIIRFREVIFKLFKKSPIKIR